MRNQPSRHPLRRSEHQRVPRPDVHLHQKQHQLSANLRELDRRREQSGCVRPLPVKNQQLRNRQQPLSHLCQLLRRPLERVTQQ